MVFVVTHFAVYHKIAAPANLDATFGHFDNILINCAVLVYTKLVLLSV